MEENLTLDLLFSMLNPDLEQLLARCCVDTAEGKKLLSALDLLTTYYGKRTTLCYLCCMMSL